MALRPFIPNPGFSEEFAREPDTVDGLLEQAEEARQLAYDLAPVDEGDYREGLRAVAAGGEVFVIGTDYKSALIEYGSQNNPVFAPLRRGAQAANLSIEESPKE